jgi:hypothetical protein
MIDEVAQHRRKAEACRRLADVSEEAARKALRLERLTIGKTLPLRLPKPRGKSGLNRRKDKAVELVRPRRVKFTDRRPISPAPQPHGRPSKPRSRMAGLCFSDHFGPRVLSAPTS